MIILYKSFDYRHTIVKDSNFYKSRLRLIAMQKETAQLLFKLAFSKKNWGGKYDRLEHFKRFPNLKKIVKNLSKIGWLNIQNKPTYTNISLNTKFKGEIIRFIEANIPEIKGMVK